MVRDYDPLAKILHWSLFLLVAAQYAIGEFMPHIGRDTPNEGLVALHFSVGALILVVLIAALVRRLVRPVPQLSDIPVWQQRLATLMHWSLYLLLFAMTILGWAATNGRGWSVQLLGFIPFPAIAQSGDSWAHEAGDIHMWLVNVLLALVAVHVAAALYHHFVAHDSVLKRMLPSWKKSKA